MGIGMTNFIESGYQRERRCRRCEKKFTAHYPQEMKCDNCVKKSYKYRFCKGSIGNEHEFFMLDKAAIWCPYCRKPTKLRIGRIDHGRTNLPRGRIKGKLPKVQKDDF